MRPRTRTTALPIPEEPVVMLALLARRGPAASGCSARPGSRTAEWRERGEFAGLVLDTLGAS
jgi:hypothetical protein